MKVAKHDGSTERQILIGMIVDQSVISAVSIHWTKNMFKSQWANLVGRWCVDYFQLYNEPIGKSIETKFQMWSEQQRDESTVKMVSTFLSSLSGEYEEVHESLNSEFVVDMAAKYFNQVRRERLANKILEAVQHPDRDDEAEAAIAAYTRVEMGGSKVIDVLNDKETIRRAFELQDNDVLISYPGKLGEFFGRMLSRNSFVSLEGIEKRGKSYWLLDLAWRGMLGRRRVMFFELGDLSMDQAMRRFMCRAAQRPLYPQDVKYPIDIYREKSEKRATVKHEELKFKTHLDWRRAQEACFEVMTRRLKTQDSYFKLSCHSNTSLNVLGMRELVDQQAQRGWVPDIIIADYADIMAPLPGRYEQRDQINETWKRLRKLSQDYHCLVITATQAPGRAYEEETLSMGSYGEDKRKRAHVTASFGLNATPEERDNGVTRVNCIVSRTEYRNVKACVHVAGCVALANPAIKSCM